MSADSLGPRPLAGSLAHTFCRLAVVGLLAPLLLAVQPVEATFRLGYVIQNGERVPTPLGYSFRREISHVGLDQAEDLFIDSQGNLFVADTGNRRVLKLNQEGRILGVFSQWTNGEGLIKPTGVFVSKSGEVYVADVGGEKIVVFHPDGTLKRVFPRPVTKFMAGSYQYQPSKIVVDAVGRMYVISEGDYRGLVLLDPDGNFRGFFGSNRVSFLFRAVLLRYIMTEAQRVGLYSRQLPPPHSNAVIDDYGFIYSTTWYDTNNQIKKLSPVGVDVYNGSQKRLYGEIEIQGIEIIHPRFVDLAVDGNGIISALDARNGKLYQYDQQGNLLLVFGERGGDRGQFLVPSSVSVDREGRLYVLDKERNGIQVFEPTEYGRSLHLAARQYSEGDYVRASGTWERILKMNGNLMLAYSGIGKALLKQKRYEDAMRLFRRGEDRAGFSKSFAKARYLFLRRSFSWVLLGLIGAIASGWVLLRGVRWIAGIPAERAGFFATLVQIWVTMLTNPAEAVSEIRERTSVLHGTVLIVVMALVRLVRLRYTSFQLSAVRPEDILWYQEVLVVLLPWALFVVANCAISTIWEGKGFLGDVATTASFAVSPYILASLVMTGASHAATVEQGGLFSVFSTLVAAYCGVLLTIMIAVLHDFDLRKIIAAMGITAVGMMTIVIVSVISYGFINQMYVFGQQVLTEVRVR